MKNLLTNTLFKAILAVLLVLAMCAFQYESGVSDFKFWISSLIILCVMIYFLLLISGLVKKVKTYEKESTELKSQLKELVKPNTDLTEENQ